ncbi:uroporphyrinogen-III C-methyltransferase [Leptospira inadai serovar Lyme str. 10]|uniref:uroporphyrinogen-III C-methyltransferase n=2 Tax=Leptospira inadai serovar Lyme TaxID=293084 RepID=V6HTC1_9LEPT|nr:uroporphyrinogen-III C-methyltransferase [Leptospira inadai]EQA35934.1 uroporphyrinogen-III C-methyltransferase [Leptospira inadai serovar Lyme str. 10]PNV76752.1 uroporphyrinogen-III C-methyltransferase [Leptospira inadai serovar Lyme]
MSALGFETPADTGKIFLVGAGPGDPELLTVKAIRILRKAQVVLYDDLVSPKVLHICRKNTELIYVGKRLGQHSCAQDEINAKIADAARHYAVVVRLKGGDPSIFGRVGEEYAYLISRGFECEIVAGITTGSAIAAHLGFPLTHRDYAGEIVFLSGHRKEGQNSTGFRNLICKDKTIIVYMGLNSLGTIVDQLLDGGNSESTPVAIIENATLPSERIVIGNLDSILEKVESEKIQSPALIVVGEVVRFYLEMKELKERNLLKSVVA